MFKLGGSNFVSQVYEDTIEQDTMICKETFHFDINTLYAITNDYRYGLLNDSDYDDRLSQTVVMTFKVCDKRARKSLEVRYKKVQAQNRDVVIIEEGTAIYSDISP